MAANKLFWGLHIESGKAYTQTVNQGFAIRQAVVEKGAGDSRKSQGPPESVRVFAKYENADFILCVLSPNKLETSQAPLNVKFETGAQLTLRVDGAPNATVHLTGHCIPSVNHPSTPSSAIAIPFEGQQKSILVSSKKNGEPEKSKKRVSIDELPGVAKANNKSVSFGGQGEDEDDDDDDDDSDDEAFIRNGLQLGDDDDDDDDDDDAVEEEATTEDDTDGEDGDGLAIFGKKIAALNKKLKQDAASQSKKKKGDDEEMEEDDDDDDEDDDDDDEDDDDGEDDDDDVEDQDEDIGISIKGNSYQSTPKTSKIPEKTAKSDPTSKTSKNNKKNEAKTPDVKDQNSAKKNSAELKTPERAQTAPKTPSSAGHTPMKFVSKGGVMVQELKVGGGPIAKPGKMVAVYYQGRLKQNNKLFDKSDKGPGFKFRLGQGEVIKGWDIGVEGMKVGGKRKIIIPANLAYGKRGAPPDIPPNSTLTFDIELKHVS